MKKITEQQLSQHAKELSEQIIAAAKSSNNETELRLKTYPLLENFVEALDLNIDSRHEYPLISGRADALYNRFIIEYKAPGVLQHDNAHKANQKAIEQTKGYILGLAKNQRKRSERYVAVVLDGYYLIFIRFRHGRVAFLMNSYYKGMYALLYTANLDKAIADSGKAPVPEIRPFFYFRSQTGSS